ncbi:MAG TPA: hypothetical protein VHG32_26990 [Thermoanaerobaculia bacterium]|nr:hypothetical protein [Thermoanaerobaculia bacterium]
MAAVLTFAGSRFAGVLGGPRDSALYRLALYSLAGWVGLHLLLTALGLAGLPWRLPVVTIALGAAVGLAWRFLPAPADRTRLPSELGWGEAVALAAVAVFTVCALSAWIATPDFIYHWGLKGRRFYLAGGVDYRYLGASWNWVVHPDYPNLLPELFAVTALAAGRFDEPAMMLWSAGAFALLLAAVREALRRAEVSSFAAQAALAGLAMALAAYGIGGLSAGGADWLIALALAAALPPLLAPADLRGAAQIGLAAAFAAASKVEGLPLGAGLAVIYAARLWAASPAARTRPAARGDGARRWLQLARWLQWLWVPQWLRRLRWPRPVDPRALAALTLPLLAVTVPWLAGVRRYHLFGAYNSGPLVLERLPRVLAAIAAVLHGSWYGFAYALLLLPLIALDRRLRPLAAVVALQLLFYLYVYLSVRVDPVTLVGFSFSRLVLHVLPAILTGAVIWLDGRRGASPGPGPGRSDPGGARAPTGGAAEGASPLASGTCRMSTLDMRLADFQDLPVPAAAGLESGLAADRSPDPAPAFDPAFASAAADLDLASEPAPVPDAPLPSPPPADSPPLAAASPAFPPADLPSAPLAGAPPSPPLGAPPSAPPAEAPLSAPPGAPLSESEAPSPPAAGPPLRA